MNATNVGAAKYASHAQLLEKKYLELARNSGLWEESLSTFLHTTVEHVSQVMCVERVSIFLLNDQHTQLDQIALYTASNAEHSSGTILKYEDYPVYFKALTTKRIIAASNAHTDPSTSEFSENYLTPLNIGAMLDTSLHKAGRMRGVICVEHIGGTRSWTEEEKVFLVSIADLVSQRLLYKKLQDRTDYYSEMASFNEAIVNSSTNYIITLDLSGIIQTVNLSACAFLKSGEKELKGLDLFTQLITPSDKHNILLHTNNGINFSHSINFSSMLDHIKEGRLVDCECLFLDSLGNAIPVSITVSELKDTDANIKGYLCTARDIKQSTLTRKALKDREELYSFVFEISADSILMIKNDLIIDCNQAALKMFACTREQIIGSSPDIFSARKPNADGSIRPSNASKIIKEATYSDKKYYNFIAKDFNDRVFIIEATLNNGIFNNETVIHAHLRDITERKNTEKELLLSREKLETHNHTLTLINDVSKALLKLDSEEDIYTKTLEVLSKAENLCGISIYSVDTENQLLKLKLQKNLTDRPGIHFPTIQIEPDRMVGIALSTGQLVYSADLKKEHRTKVNKQVFLDLGVESLAVLPLVYRDKKIAVLILGYINTDSLSPEDINALHSLAQTISISLVNAQRLSKLDYMAHHDSLTGLSNRVSFHNDFIKHTEQNQSKSAAIYLLDLDRFKEVNDTLGHFAGDKILQMIGPRLTSLFDTKNAQITRLGGDEFVVIVYDVDNHADAKNIAKAICNSLSQPFMLNDINMSIEASVGIALYPQDGSDSHALLRSADVAMYNAKNSALPYSLYSKNSDIHTPKRLTMIAEMSNSIRKGQLFLHYQPKIDLHTNTISGFEALARWDHPQLGLLAPSMFIPLMEMTKSIHDLTEEILNQALMQQLQWRKIGLNYSIAVNLSVRNLADERILTLLKTLIAQYDTPPGMLELEITETALMQDQHRAITILKKISELGIKLSIDDFGTGYSSLSYLSTFPIHKLKMDRKFIMDMLTTDQGVKIVETIISLAKTMDLTVIAEGVEDKATYDQLVLMKCDQAQGYYICKPNSSEKIELWIKQNTQFS